MASADSMGVSALLTMRQSCSILQCHPNSLRSWANQGKIACYRIGPQGKRRFLRDDVLALAGLDSNKNEKIDDGGQILIYARVSSSGQKGDLVRQVERLQSYIRENYGREADKVLSEIGSGLSATRKQFNSLIEGMLSGKYRDSLLVLTHHDRLCRHGDYLFMAIAKFSNVKLVFIEDQKIEGEEGEIARDIVEILTHYSAKIHTKRSAERLRKRLSPELTKRIFELRASGHSVAKINIIVNSEGFRCADASGKEVAVGIGPIVRILNEKPQLEQRQANSVVDYFNENITLGDGNLRIRKETLYDDYATWCRQKQIDPLNPHAVGRKLTQLGLDTVLVHDRGSGTKLAWRAVLISKKEKLSFVVKPRKRGKPQPIDSSGETSFSIFYRENLAGSGKKLFARELWNDYRQWCQDRQLRPDKFNTMAMQLLELGGHYSTKYAVNGQGGMRYSF